MVKLRHVLHPLRSARTLYQRSRTAYYIGVSKRVVSQIPRRDITKCWCGGSLKELTAHPQYGICEKCGCYVNLRPPATESLKKFYSLEDYWHLRQRVHGLPTIEKRASLYRSDGRLRYWLGLVQQFGPSSGTIIEVGCAPGVLLAELSRKGYKCLGVEPDASVADWVRESTGIEVREGLFPEVQLPLCDLLLALDVAEHAPDPIAFWKGIAALLQPGGVAIVQTPIESSDFEHPFRTRPEFFDGLEHLYLYTDMSVRKLAGLAELEVVTLGDAMGGYLSQFCVLAKHAPTASDKGFASGM